MYRLWGKIIKHNKIQESIVIYNTNERLTLTQKRNICLEEICYKFDLQYPAWFNQNEKDYSMFYKTSFNADNFMEPIDFDILEIEYIPEDKI